MEYQFYLPGDVIAGRTFSPVTATVIMARFSYKSMDVININRQGMFVLKCNYCCTFARLEKETFQLYDLPKHVDVSDPYFDLT